jgi:diguanylate cyclase (GGDEF)-like protein
LASAKDLLSRIATVTSAYTALEGLIHLAFTDPTTSLHNRRALDEISRLALEFDKLAYGVVMLDLTGFKRVNDAGSHAAGDAALRLVGATLQRMCGADGPFAGALAFRHGGDEFCILVPKTVFEKFIERSHLSQLRWDDFTLQEKSLGFSTAIGIADPDEEVGLVELIGRADAAAKLSKDRNDEPVRWAARQAVASIAMTMRSPGPGTATAPRAPR